jgi:hypothetical protein
MACLRSATGSGIRFLEVFMSGWICGSAAVLAVVLVIWRLDRRYNAIFANEHFIEFARGVAGVKAAAYAEMLDLSEVRPLPPGDHRVFLSSAGIALVYTISPRNARFDHHFSVSFAGWYTPKAVGESFVLLTAKALGVPYHRLDLGVGGSTAHHADLQLSEEEHEAMRHRPVPELSLADVEAFRKEWTNARPTLEWRDLTRIASADAALPPEPREER